MRDHVEPKGSDLSIFTNELHVIMNFKWDIVVGMLENSSIHNNAEVKHWMRDKGLLLEESFTR